MFQTPSYLLWLHNALCFITGWFLSAYAVTYFWWQLGISSSILQDFAVLNREGVLLGLYEMLYFALPWKGKSKNNSDRIQSLSMAPGFLSLRLTALAAPGNPQNLEIYPVLLSVAGARCWRNRAPANDAHFKLALFDNCSTSKFFRCHREFYKLYG